MIPFNQLTPAEAERLAVLAEEMGEAIQAIGKILRHGYESENPDEWRDTGNNRCHLEKELGDVRYAMIALCDAGDLRKDRIHTSADKKKIRIQQYLHEQVLESKGQEP